MADAGMTQARMSKMRLWACLGSLVFGALMAAAVWALPGRAGASAVRACAAAAFAFFVFAVHRRTGIIGDGGAGLRDLPSAPSAVRNRLAATGAAGAVAGIGCTLALSPAASVLAGADGSGFFAWGLAGFSIAVVALVAWSKAYLRNAARWQPPGSAGGGVGGSIACAAACAIGLGACFNIVLTPVRDIGAHAVATGLSIAAVLALGAWWLFHIPKMATRLDTLHDHLESTEGMLGALAASYSSLAGEHERAREENRAQAAEIESMREQQARELEKMRRRQAAEIKSIRRRQGEEDTLSADDVEAICARIAEEAQLSSREHDVLTLLARGWTRGRIAEELVLEKSTVSSHVVRLYRKLDVHSAQELIEYVERRA